MIEVEATPLVVSDIDQETAPHEFICPISRQVMKNPVITLDGYSFEKQAIQKWFQTKNTSPITGLKLENKIIQNRALRQSIAYHNLRDLKASQNAQKLIQVSFQYLSSTLPQFIDDIGLLNADKLVSIAIQNIGLRKNMAKIISIIKKIQSRNILTQTQYCDVCTRMKDGLFTVKQVLKDAEHILLVPPIIDQKDLTIQSSQFQYLPISIHTLKEIDFRLSRNQILVKKKFKSFGIEKLPLQTILKKIKQVNNIPKQHFMQVWRTKNSPSQIFRRIKKQLEQQSCSYIQKIKQQGKRIHNLKLHLDQLKLQPDQYLIFEHGSNGPPKPQLVFRGEETKCRYCYKMKPQKVKCTCDNISYCSLECAQKDRDYHKRQCSQINLISL